MLLDIVIISVIIGLLRRGTLKGELKLKKTYIVPFALLLQILGTWLLPQHFKPFAVIISYIGLLVFTIHNIEKTYIKLICLGVFLNLIVIAANGGMMPVSLDSAVKVGYDVAVLREGTVFKQQALTDKTILSFLGDVIPLQYPIPRVISVGDISIFVGVFLLLQDFMGRPLNILSYFTSHTKK